MEATLSIISPRTSSPSPQPTANPLHLRRRRNVQNQDPLPMPLIDLALLRRVTTRNSFRFRLKNYTSSISPEFMADEPKKTDSQPAAATVCEKRDEEKIGSEKKMDPPVPPPPEKPLPGDCSGSGCVRCVWDVYYEELEEYDKLYKAN